MFACTELIEQPEDPQGWNILMPQIVISKIYM